MWKMVFGLCAAMYGLAVLVGPAEKAAELTEKPQIVLVETASVVQPSPPFNADIIKAAFTAKQTAVPAIAETYLDKAPKRPELVMRKISFIAPISSPAAVAPTASTSPDEQSSETTVKISARSVNLRAGPSTQHNVLTSLQRGTEAVLIEEMSNGWSKISVSDNKIRGFIASRFLSEG